MPNYHEEYDVIICGGGTSGVAAAIAAARTGANTLLVERMGALGGQLSVSGPPGFAFAHLFNPCGEQDAAGIIEEIHRRLLEEGHALPHLKPAIRLRAGYTFSYIDPDWFNLVIFDMMEENKVNLLLHTLVVDVMKERNRVTGIVVENADGRREIKGKIVVDCTGEGDIASRAGAPYEIVSQEEIQPQSLAFTADGVDWKELLAYIHTNPDQFTYFELTLPEMTKEEVEEVRKEAEKYYGSVTDVTQLGEIMGFYKLRDHGLETGEWHQYAGVGFFLTPREGGHIQAHFQHSAQVPGIMPTDAWSLSKGEAECRKQIQIAWKFFKKYVPGFKNAYITRICPEMRIREGRRIMGDYKLTRDDVAEGKKFRDVIGKSHFKAGAHHAANSNTIVLTNKCAPKDGGSHDIPYRCLVPLGVENLLVAGKMISTDRDAYQRYVQQTMITGQAAGAAAALCAKHGVSPRMLEQDVSELQRILKNQGAVLDGTH
jgi:Dehydrogenases (flavoproteins)